MGLLQAVYVGSLQLHEGFKKAGQSRIDINSEISILKMSFQANPEVSIKALLEVSIKAPLEVSIKATLQVRTMASLEMSLHRIYEI